MAQKEENPIASKAGTDAKNGSAKPAKEQATAAPESVERKKQVAAQSGAGGLSPEVVELVTELRDTVKRIDPRKHTPKTLRRSLSNVSDILKDIEAFYQES